MQNKSQAMDHLKNHQSYPATKAQLVAECDNLSDFSADDKKEFMESLPGGTYNSADEVVKALGWQVRGSKYYNQCHPEILTVQGSGW